MRHRWLVCLLFAALGVSHGAADTHLLGVTEDVPPFSYLEGGRFAGLANEVLDRIANQSGLKVQRSIQPFARGLKTVDEVPNSFLYVMVRTPARESHYRWVGPLDDCDVVVLTLRSSGLDFSPTTPDARALRVGAVKGSPAGKMLRDAGMPERSIYLTPGSETSTRMLFAGHLDMIAGLALPYQHQATRLGLDTSQMQVAHLLQKGFGCYFAFNPKVDPVLYKRFADAFDVLRSSGELRQLRERSMQAPALAPAQAR
ncbi:transporter substrate-binding domain-containing protein [Paucibacter sp. APW11]|uniref:Transporter substrate-binding domain-containing protein n=1 Tax=Roseateles aquae TaxID=3077235 RepID=A0ABU3PF36_9BURK|nr:transporter substrate-binding domain-containing protein [Paucibacter sp. APW11]MDT9000718.1 transporter substrate-binding domain-containing protein [Paucibacter sp. APW11]